MFLHLKRHIMKAILEFDLPDEQPDFEAAINGYKWESAMWDMNQYLRSVTKYAPDETSEEVVDALEKARNELFNILSNYNLEIK